MTTLSDIKAVYALAVASMEAGDFADAELRLMVMEGHMSIKPDTDFAKEGMTFSRESISNLRVECGRKARAKSTSSGEIVQIPVRRRSSALES